MADEAKIIFELKDSGSGPTPSAAGGSSPSGSIPGSDLAQQYQQQLSTNPPIGLHHQNPTPPPYTSPQSLASNTPDVVTAQMVDPLADLRAQLFNPVREALNSYANTVNGNAPQRQVYSAEQQAQAAENLGRGANLIGGLTGMQSAGAFVNQTAPLLAPYLPAGAASALAAAGPALVGVGAAAGLGLATGYAGLNEAERARSIAGPYSGAVAQAEADAQVRQIMANLRTAETLGPEAAGYVQARSRMDVLLQEIRDKLAEAVIPIVTEALENLLKIYELLRPMIEIALQTLPYVLEFFKTFTILGWWSRLAYIYDLLVKLGWIEARKEDDLNSPFTWFERLAHLALPPEYSGGEAITPAGGIGATGTPPLAPGLFF